MIQANELRIGNWVKSNIYQQVTVEILDWLSNDRHNHDSLQPIPLTPEILEKCGFVRNELMAKHNTVIWYGDHIGVKGILGVVKPCECGYLHQLQNLYFALTGEELTVNL